MTQADYADDVKQIKQIRRAVEEAEKTRDADALGELLGESVGMRPEDGPQLTGWQTVVDHHRELWADFDDIDAAFSIEDIAIVGGLAVETGTYELTLVPAGGGDPIEALGRYLYTYEKDAAGDWKVHRMSW